MRDHLNVLRSLQASSNERIPGQTRESIIEDIPAAGRQPLWCISAERFGLSSWAFGLAAHWPSPQLHWRRWQNEVLDSEGQPIATLQVVDKACRQIIEGKRKQAATISLPTDARANAQI